ncbi:MAG: hypothetical protein IJ374_00110 [Lachnospiraceae bacterium]|nr:hypothetical protein [Lachnospiraceae bacterium]
MINNEKKNEEQILYREDCEEEERAKRALERAEKERFIDGLKRYPEKGVQVYIDGKVAGPFDWEKLTMLREDNRFYMGDFVQDESGLREIRFDMVYHGDIQTEREYVKKRGKKRVVKKEEKEGDS